jgi:hypothetical protein
MGGVVGHGDAVGVEVSGRADKTNHRSC